MLFIKPLKLLKKPKNVWNKNDKFFLQAALSVGPGVEMHFVCFRFSKWLYTAGLRKGGREGRRGLVVCNCLMGSFFAGNLP